MDKAKKFVFGFIVIILALYIISPITLDKIGDRVNPYSPNSSLMAEIKNETVSMTGEDIRKYSIRKTASRLSFSAHNNLAKGEANCIGYAQMCAAIANYAFRQNGLSCNAKPVVGYVRFFGLNVCYVLSECMPTQYLKNFVKDHDFVEFQIGGQTIYADANAYDYLWMDCKTSK